MTSCPPDPGEITKIVQAGVLAPSGDNCQPWRFAWDGQVLQVVFVPERAASLYDVDHTASWVALGALLTNMRVAAHELGYQLDVQLTSLSEENDRVAQVKFQPSPQRGDPLFPALTTRCVNRRVYDRNPLPTQLKQEFLNIAATTPGASLTLVEEERRKSSLASLAARNEQIVFENRILHDGLYRWIRWTADEATRTGDGMPVESLELTQFERPGFRLLASWSLTRWLTALGATSILPLRTQHIYQRSAAIGLLTVAGSRFEDFVRGGEVMERFWLSASLRGVAFQPITGLTFLLLRCRLAQGEGLSQPHQQLLETIEPQLTQFFPDWTNRTPIMLFRIGFAPPPSGRAPRRPVEASLTITTS